MQYVCKIVFDHVTIDQKPESKILGGYEATRFQIICFYIDDWHARKLNSMDIPVKNQQNLE